MFVVPFVPSRSGWSTELAIHVAPAASNCTARSSSVKRIAANGRLCVAKVCFVALERAVAMRAWSKAGALEGVAASTRTVDVTVVGEMSNGVWQELAGALVVVAASLRRGGGHRAR
jgi:hypothetical protein